MPIEAIPLKRRKGDIQLMNDQFGELKRDLTELKDGVAHLVTLHKLGQKDHDSFDQAIKRSYIRIEKLEDRQERDIRELKAIIDLLRERLEDVKTGQASNEWVNKLAMATLTGVGGLLAIYIMSGGFQ